MLNSIYPDSILPGQGNLIARINGFSFAVEASQIDINYFLALEENIATDEPTDHLLQIFTEMELSDTKVTLVGFSSEERRELYKSLKNVAGIGTKSALIILDSGDVTDILRAVSGKENEFLREVPGVGPKRIESIFKELEKKYRKALPKPIPVKVSEWVESREAVVSAGVSIEQAESFVAEAVSSLEDSENEKELKRITSEKIYQTVIQQHPEIVPF